MELKLLLEQISNLLFYPALVLLVALLAWILVALGMFARGAWQRLRGRRPAQTRYLAMIEAVAREGGEAPDLRLEAILMQAENAAQRSLDTVRFAVRAGPSLGLMGTLIPMAAALNGLARGDLPDLAGNMVVAFSSTVVGIAVGVVAYVIAMVREGWSHEDLDAIRLRAEQVLRDGSDR